VNLDDSQLAKHLIAATGRAKLLAVIGNQSVACHTDPLFRNGVLAHIRKLQDVRIMFGQNLGISFICGY